MRSPCSFLRLGVLAARLRARGALVVPLLCAAACVYETRGVIEGQLTRYDPSAPPPQPSTPTGAAPAPTHQAVRFTWQSTDGGLSGQIQTALPDGEAFMGKFHEVAPTVLEHGGWFCRRWYGGWYGDPWLGPSWSWGGAWPYHGSCDGFVTYYTGRVVALLDGDHGARMRCHFTLDEPGTGMRGGGWGECQVSTGERIDAMFDPGDAQDVQPLSRTKSTSDRPHPTTASTSISTRNSSPMSPACSMLVAGRCSPKNSACARPKSSQREMSVTNMRVRTTCSRPAPSSRSAFSMISRLRLACR